MTTMTITKKNLKSLQNCSKEFDILVDTIRSLCHERNVQTMDKIQSTLKLSFNEPLVLEDMEKIERLSPDVASLAQNLGGFSAKFSVQVEAINDVIDKAFKKYRDAEEAEFDKKMDGFRKLQNKHKLWSIWSEYTIDPNDMNKAFSNNAVESLTYESWGPTQKIKVGKVASWLDMWKVADQAMKLSGDKHHQFIEAIVEDKANPGHFKLVTGS